MTKRPRDESVTIDIPIDELKCPIGLTYFVDPVTVSDGSVYERANITKWIDEGNSVSPCTRQPIKTCGRWCYDNQFMRGIVVDYMLNNSPNDSERKDWILERQRYLYRKEQYESALEYGRYDPATIKLYFDSWDYMDGFTESMGAEIIEIMKDRREALKKESSSSFIMAALIVFHLEPLEDYVTDIVTDALTLCAKRNDVNATIYHSRLCAAAGYMRYKTDRKTVALEIFKAAAEHESVTKRWYFMRITVGICALHGLCGHPKDVYKAMEIFTSILQENHQSAVLAQYWHAKVLWHSNHYGFVADDTQNQYSLCAQGISEMSNLADFVMSDDVEGEQVEYVRDMIMADRGSDYRKLTTEELLFWHSTYFRATPEFKTSVRSP